MKKYINKLLVICAFVFVGSSCENNAELTTLKEVNFTAPIEASPSKVVLKSETASQAVTTISWPAVVFPINAPVAYTLLFDTATDVTWANAIAVEAGEDVLSKSFLGTDLNKMAIKLGLTADVEGKILVRVVATLDRKITSEAIELAVTPFAKKVVFGAIYMPGSYQDWDAATAAALDAVDSGIYQGYVTFPASKGLGFKFTNERNWNQFYGADANGNLVDGSNIDFAVAKAGTYQMMVNLNTSKWTATPYAWGIIGTATAGGWNSSTAMTYDHQLKIWKFKGALLAGALKFRLNDAWTINYGAKNNNDGIMYLDNQGAYDVAEAGNYEVTFSIQEKDPTTGVYPATAIYTVKKI
ncbi:SusE domain-containing protein [Flavobacterium restrictum]|uniref:SusF/SusE family outer membrane protein n=1 Tax=Flavobacterium restrictum TaxID=2594428 RepID=A0A553E3F7_9FLAO|nr:SusF/SusE family outer membrane protein [Flavobacterium restrictum]TRX39433.1 SusF/SusE family outer membrane protein [Flavobacterium restrictum]